MEFFINGDFVYLQEWMIVFMVWLLFGGGGLMDGLKFVLVVVFKCIVGEQGVDEVVVVVVWLFVYLVCIVLVFGINMFVCIVKISEVVKVEIDWQIWFEFYILVIGKEVF